MGFEKVFKPNAVNFRDGVRMAMDFTEAGSDDFSAGRNVSSLLIVSICEISPPMLCPTTTISSSR